MRRAHIVGTSAQALSIDRLWIWKFASPQFKITRPQADAAALCSAQILLRGEAWHAYRRKRACIFMPAMYAACSGLAP
jgi:hypothetical protein